MSVIAGHTAPGSVETEYIATVKGAPETLKPMVRFFNHMKKGANAKYSDMIFRDI